MIDTIALTLPEGSFTILNHDRFSPNTENLFRPPFIKVTGRAPFKAVNNPTKQDREKHGYLPRITLYKAVRTGGFPIFLIVEFSIPKLLYGNNFDEVDESDFGEVCWKLKKSLLIMGVEIKESDIISEAQVSTIHYSKNIILTDYSIPYSYTKEISKINVNHLQDINQTDYRNEGHAFKYRSNDFEVIFYDKLIDLMRAKISEKRAIEPDNYGQLNLLDELKRKDPFEVLRMEVRIGSRRKLKQILQKHSLTHVERNFKELFSREISQKILLSNLNDIETAYPKVLRSDTETISEFMTNIQVNNPDLKFKAVLEFTGAYAVLKEYGVREFRKLTQRHKNHNWYRFNKAMKQIELGETLDVFETIRTALEDFDKVELVKYQDKM